MTVTHSELLNILDYNPQTGEFRWKKRVGRGRHAYLTTAGSVQSTGYLAIRYQGKQYVTHRLAWFYVHGYWPSPTMKHLNGNKLDNRIDNLAEVSSLNEKHSMSRSPEWNSWFAMRRRIHDPKKSEYQYYGGRGIKVCERWDNSFAAFLEDMGPRPEGYSLDRIDPDGDYEPGNCRWADIKTQNSNKRNTRVLAHNGCSMRVAEWADVLGITVNALNCRLRRLPVERALSL